MEQQMPRMEKKQSPKRQRPRNPKILQRMRVMPSKVRLFNINHYLLQEFGSDHIVSLPFCHRWKEGKEKEDRKGKRKRRDRKGKRKGAKKESQECSKKEERSGLIHTNQQLEKQMLLSWRCSPLCRFRHRWWQWCRWRGRHTQEEDQEEDTKRQLSLRKFSQRKEK